ncbi:LuxR C-terminal-related transcriptional regulator [Arthrobacter sp. CJ23]|uniref:helix-turn-helix transcriptional regulator n=1 Tax=Arthrobacter sp. CJ23 TaxID=2972479 RepID=UPI00215C63BD|nr:LuxR C-terminal-related transcriptional regulator [Arthrobacter sp. CJ23]UVJ40916.1 LuxR C-terminal-related transcriptional regulator [Arthrobacter sp. CJ23]
MASSCALSRSRERMETLFQSSADGHALRVEALEELRLTLGFSAFVWPLADPETATGVAPLAELHSARDLPLLIKGKYASTVNRWTALSLAATPVGTLRSSTAGGAAGAGGLWEDMLRGQGVGDVASVVHADQYGIWSWLDLWRDAGDAPFSESETAFLASLAPAMTRGLRRSCARQFQAGAVPAKPAPPQADLVVDEDMGVLGQTASAGAWLSLLQRAPGPYSGIPAEVFNVVGQLLAKEARVDHHAAAARVHIGSGRWAALRAARMDRPWSAGHDAATPQAPAIAVTIQECLPAARLGVFVRAYGLTPRERQALALLAAGLENEALAGRMGIAGYTVQDHFKAIFAKTGMRSRAGVLALALGGSAADDAAYGG